MSELRCPFCGKFLDAVVKNQNDWIYSCGNPSCEFFDDCDNYEKKHYLATPEFWQELIRTRKALDFTREGFDAAREAALVFCKRTDIAMCALAKISKQHPGTCNKEWYVAVARDALEQITALEQKD